MVPSTTEFRFTHDWMKGAVSSAEVISELAITMDGRYRDDFLARRLNADCKRMRVNVGVLDALWRLTPVVPVVLATDNMDCFAKAITSARTRKRKNARRAEFNDWADLYDDVICSSDIGALKAENPQAFFGPTLAKYGLQFADALLIDDRADNCAAFRHEGGSTVQWKMGANDEADVVAGIHQWLKWPVPSAPHETEKDDGVPGWIT